VSIAAAQPSSRKKRRWPLVALVAVLIPLVAVGAAYVVRGVTAGPPVAHETIYRDPQHRFSFQRPALWHLIALPNGVTLTDSDNTSTITSTATITVEQPMPGEVAKAHADTLATQQTLTAAPAQQIGGDTWEQRSGQVTGADGAVREVVVFVTLHEGQLYVIQLSSPLNSFSGVNSLVYQPLLASFTFGG
jgi:hypothetical protein